MTPSRLILLPGLDGTGELFGPLLGVVPRRLPIRVISYPTEQTLRYDDLLNLIDSRLAVEGAMVLIAESFSGPLALRYAAMNLERVQAVILCASFICSPVPRWLRFFAKSLFFGLPLPTSAIRYLLVGWSATVELVQMVKQAIRKVPPQVLARRMKDVFDVDCSEALRLCTVPILYLGATQDALVRRSSIAAIRAIRPDVQVRMIDGPHLLLQREPLAAWREIERFLAEISIISRL
jgi:pimeloyl-ACP methyl ester carboxylesterase